jgi:hypothetical protein
LSISPLSLSLSLSFSFFTWWFVMHFNL